MRRVLITLATMGLAVGALVGGVGAQGADPLRPAEDALVIPYFTQAPGNLYFLVLASPKGNNSQLRLNFYTTTCNREADLLVPLSVNDTQVIRISPSITSAVEGAILISGPIIGLVDLQAPVIARGLWFDVNTGATRVVDPAVGRVKGVGGQHWSPYDSASAYIWAPRDDGVEGEARVLFSCPVGQAPRTLAFDMGLAGPPYDTLKGPIILHALIYDTNENFLADVVLECQCVGVRPRGSTGPFLSFPRLSDLSPFWASVAGGTYTEFESFTSLSGPRKAARHMGYMDVQINPSGCPSGACPATGHFFGRLHPGHFKDFTSD